MRKYYIHILLIILGTILYFMANFQRVAIPGPIFDTLQVDFNISAPFVTAFGAVFMYVYALSLLAVGIMVDKFSGIKVILIGGIVFSLGAVIFAHTDNLWISYFARALLGFGAATFYLSLIQEAKKCFPDKYFGIAISIILFTGFLGGVFANAPFVMLSDNFGWKEVLGSLGWIIVGVTIAYAIIQALLKNIHENEKINFCLQPFKEVIASANNRQLCAFVAINGGLYYSIQTVIGVKFLKDFLNYSTEFAAIILSVMIVVAAFSGIILATLSKLCNNRRVIFLKVIGILSIFIFLTISLFIIFNIKTSLIAVLIMLLSICGGLSPLTVPILHNTNRYEIRSTAISLMNCVFFLVVGMMGTVIGFLLDLFPAVSKIGGHVIYGNNSYLTVFLLFFILSIIEVFCVFQVKHE